MVEMKGKPRVMVYGTLKKGHCNHILLKDATFLGYDSITGPVKLYDLGTIPAAVETPGVTNTIKGEVYAINEEILAGLDLMEGHPTLYKRIKARTDVGTHRVWVYHCQAAVDKYNPTEIKSIWRPFEEELDFWEEHENQAA